MRLTPLLQAQLWELLGRPLVPMRSIAAHAGALAATLAGLPLVIYTAAFVVHLAVLPDAGSGDGFMSTAFQARLVGGNFGADAPEMVSHVSSSSIITLRGVCAPRSVRRGSR